jgi:hypothetical protein
LSLHVACSQCGGANEVPFGDAIVHCVFCSSALAVDRGSVVARYRVGRTVDRQGALAALRRWMASDRTATGLDKEAAVREPRRQVVPYWVFRIASPQGERAIVEPAAAVWGGLGRMGIPAGALEPRREAEAGAEELPLAQTAASAREWLRHRFGADLALEETSLVDVPVWRCVYSHRGTLYAAFVDGVSGAVFAEAYPPKREAPYRWVAGLGLALFLFEGLAIANLTERLAAFALTTIPLLAAALWATRRR